MGDTSVDWLDRLSGKLYINGADVATPATFEVINPATGDRLATVCDASVDNGIVAIDAAAGALPGWSRTAPRERAEVLRKCYELMVAESEGLARLISLENGKTLADSRSEVAYAAEFFRWYSEEAVRLSGKLMTAPSGNNKIMVTQQAIGVCVLVTPWNFPAAMATRKIAPALAAGCTTVLKPAPATPLTALAIAQLMTEAGVPPGAVNVLPTQSAGPLVQAMLHDNRVRKLSFTGSTEVGRILLAEAADQVLKCSMELGGNAPVVILPDADLQLAVREVMVAKMRNGGQACTAANRILVHEEIHDAFAAMLTDAMRGLAMGDGTDAAVECGPMIDNRAVAKVHSLVVDAAGGGATVLTGGNVPDTPGSFYPPTVVSNVPRDSAILGQEIFGPIATITPFKDDGDAIEMANRTEHGLVAYLFGSDLRRLLAMAEQIESGMVGINRGIVSDPAAPFGGMKQSGLGREGGEDGIREFLESKYIAVAW